MASEISTPRMHLTSDFVETDILAHTGINQSRVWTFFLFTDEPNTTQTYMDTQRQLC